MNISTTTQILTEEKYDRRVLIVGKLGLDEHLGNEHNTKIETTKFIKENFILRNLPFKKISSGGYHCSFLTDTNEIYSVGSNFLGQCGTGDFEDCITPKRVSISNSLRIKTIQSSGRHSLILTEDGKVFSYGCGDEGRLGLGPLISYNINKPTVIHNLLDYRVNYIAAGFWHNIVGTDCGRIFSWGSNDEGKLGLGDLKSRSFPCEIESLRGKYVSSACGGAWHTMLLTTDNQLYSWGSNYWGQLGLDKSNPRDRLTPAKVEFFDKIKIKEIAAGSNFSLCLSEDGDVYSWGCGANSKLGHGSTDTQFIPKRIESFTEKIKKIAAGSNHCLFLSESGKVFSCGWNKYHQLATNFDGTMGIPMEIEALKGVEVKFISAGAFFSVFGTRSDVVYESGLKQFQNQYIDVLFNF